MLNGKRILVVDDEPDLREILKDEFELEGATVQQASNGKEAFEIFKNGQFDVVVSDIRMPGGDGFSLSKDIRSIAPLSPVIILVTGFADVSAEDALDIGVEGFVTKPFNLENIRARIEAFTTPSKERWSVAMAHDNARIIDSTDFAIGRGGICFFGDFANYRIGEYVRIKTPNLVGKGQVRWIRTEAKDGLKPAVGIEILWLDNASIDWMTTYVESKKPTAFVPRK